MKTVMKKLLSLALVAILLVSAVPFQAHAEETVRPETHASKAVPVDLYIDGAFYDQRTLTVTSDSAVKLNADAMKLVLKYPDNYTFDRWESSTTTGAVTGNDLTLDWVLKNEGYCLKLYINTKVPAHKHVYTSKITTPATCTTDGEKTFTCTGTEGTCDKPKYVETIKAPGHDMGEWTLDNGSFVRTCKTEGCNYTETKSAVQFVADGVTVKTVAIKKDEVFGTLPTPTKKTGYDFIGWFTGINGTGTKLQSSSAWDGDTFTYYAYYQENADGTKDGLSYLTIRMRTYTGSTQTNDVLLDKVELDDETNILQWLNNNEKRISDAIFKKVDSTKYEWLDRVYYNNDTKAELTSQATLADGDKTVFVKVHAVASTETNVQLYIHQYDSKNKVYNTLKIVDVGGYKAGDTITLTKMATVVKKYYSYTSIKGLYTDSTWKQMLGGQNPTASSSITVSSNGTVKYHVLLNGASGATSSKADTTNPKTGDMILVPVMVMVASAAAAAFVYMNSKKRAR